MLFYVISYRAFVYRYGYDLIGTQNISVSLIVSVMTNELQTECAVCFRFQIIRSRFVSKINISAFFNFFYPQYFRIEHILTVAGAKNGQII